MAANPAALAKPPPTDLDLAARVCAGDREATELLVRRHNRALYRTARAILRDDAEAEDAVQEAYIHAIRGLPSFRGESALSTWLVRIAANAALMRRRQLARASEFIVANDELAARELETSPGPLPGPERMAMNAQMRRALEQGIDSLPDSYRAVFIMREVEELSVEETAMALEIPQATVRTRCFRARAMLRAALPGAADYAAREAFGFDGERCDRIVEKVLASLR